MASCVSKALQIDNLDENLHCCFIRALMGQDNYKQATEHYQKAENLTTIWVSPPRNSGAVRNHY